MLKIPKNIEKELIEHAKNGFPLEVCGILGGISDEAKEIYKMENVDASSEHYMMDPKEQFAVIKDLRAKGLNMLAIYHSHPESPARPSEEDIRLALTPNVSYVIVSLLDRENISVRSFKINEKVIEEDIIIQD